MASTTLHAMLWPRMPAGERIADWVTWNLFLFWGRRSLTVAVRYAAAGSHTVALNEPRALASGTGYRNCPISGVALRFT